ncbi:MAG TPA: hypothetical protein VNO22_18195 [Planctomycetota bacterium]|nr:hypothetical protein [Planctomycetota bacterium]
MNDSAGKAVRALKGRTAGGLALAGTALGLLWAAVPALLSTAPPCAARVRLRTAELLSNGSFEREGETGAADWNPHGRGFTVAEGAGRGGSRALGVESRDATSVLGARQTLLLARDAPRPLRVSGWSRSEGVDGTRDEGYSLFVDVEYGDGSMLPGQAAPFDAGTHGWQRREVRIHPDRPVRSVTVHALFRGRAGRAWFDDFSVEETDPPAGTEIFEGVPVEPGNSPPPRTAPRRTLATADGLVLELAGGRVTSLRLGGRERAVPAPSGFIARDAAAGSDFLHLPEGACAPLGLRLDTEAEAQADRVIFRGRLSDLRGTDRAVTLLFALPVDARGWRWGDDVRRSRPIAGRGEYLHAVRIPCGATGMLSRYPLGAIFSDAEGLALAVDVDPPAHYRIVYHAGTRQFYVAYDLGLPAGGSAPFSFVLFRFPPRWGFRAALERLYELFPERYAARILESGTWLPFGDAGAVPGWEDFGFKFHEGGEHAAADDARGILSFRYSEPLVWWMPMAPEVPRREEEARRELERRAASGDPGARAALFSGMARDDGRRAFVFRSAPWCDGAAWSLNPNPRSPAIRELFRVGEGPPGLDGEFLDSLEGYVTAELDFDRDHARRATAPPSFCPSTGRPVIFKGQAAYEHARARAAEQRARGRFVFSNGVPRRFGFLCPWIDVLGMEADWFPDGRWRPDDDATLAFWRAMAFQKPFLLLFNTDFDRLTPELLERAFRRCLLYGIFPSCFSADAWNRPYWGVPAWYERDRPVFRKYVPLLRRLSAAGWHPVTHAACDNERLAVERFGPDASGHVYLVILNPGERDEEGRVILDPELARRVGRARELLGGRGVNLSESRFRASLEPHGAWVVEFAPSPKAR